MKMEPIKVAPVHMTLDINVKMEQQNIEDAAAETSPVIGQPAPDFTILDQNRHPVTLSALKGQWVILYFYPKDGTTGCTIEAIEFAQQLPRFHELNAEVLGISEDSIDSHCDVIGEHNLKLTLLSDPTHTVMKQYGAWIESSMGSLRYERAIRVTMIIDPAGIIRHYMPEVIPQGHAERVVSKLMELQAAAQTTP